MKIYSSENNFWLVPPSEYENLSMIFMFPLFLSVSFPPLMISLVVKQSNVNVLFQEFWLYYLHSYIGRYLLFQKKSLYCSFYASVALLSHNTLKWCVFLGLNFFGRWWWPRESVLWGSSALSEFRTSLSKVLTLWHCVKVKQCYQSKDAIFRDTL